MHVHKQSADYCKMHLMRDTEILREKRKSITCFELCLQRFDERKTSIRFIQYDSNKTHRTR